MKAVFDHVSFNVLHLDESLAFYQKALGLKEMHRADTPEYTSVLLEDGETPFRLELTYLKDRADFYDLGEGEFHLCVAVDDMREAHRLHKEMECICRENREKGIYFISDPDGYWIEIVPKKER